MVMTGNTRTKRKNNSHDLKTEPALKALKKSDIIIQFEALQKKYDALEKQNEVLLQEKSDHIESIHLLEETVKILEVKSSKVEIENKNANKKASETQTEDVDMMRCGECDYPAQDICDLGAHIHEVHGSEGFEEAITCNYCQEKFKTKDSLMVHRKKVHIERVSFCSNFQNGTCYFESDDCWCAHTKPSVMLRCTFCEKEFPIKSELMRHRKKEHSSKIKLCFKSVNGECLYQNNCWYKHEENQDHTENQNQELFNKIFDMMEKFTHRIVTIENNL